MRSLGTRRAIARNFLTMPISRQTIKISTFSELCQNRTILEALDVAGLSPYGVGPNETVLLMAKEEPLKVGAPVSVYRKGKLFLLDIPSARYFDLSRDSIVELQVELPADLPVELPIEPAPLPPPVPPSALVPIPVLPPAVGQFDLCGLVAGEKLQPVINLARKVSRFGTPVVITGETGTGKELIAKIIRRNGPRGDNPFVAINCSAIPESLIESELFGHEKGAFTGSVGRRRGVFELADKGTLFLDEIGDTSLSTQVKLLRVLQDGCFRRVGGEQPVKTDVRIISATNKDLRAEIAAGRFREDLFHRICVIDIRLPSLRERSKEEIVGLANFFLSAEAQRLNKHLTGFSAEALEALVLHSWPGNVRELQNCITQAVVLSAGEEVAAADLRFGPPASPAGSPFAPVVSLALGQGWGFRRTLDETVKTLLLAALQKAEGNKKHAAELLGVKRTTFNLMLQRHGLFGGQPE